MRIFFFLFFTFFYFPAHAGEFYLGGLSDHFLDEKEDVDLNESHSLVAYEQSQLVAAYFDNSYGEDTFAAGYHFKKRWGRWTSGVIAGASYGYRDCLEGSPDQMNSRRICPFLAPAISYRAYVDGMKVEPTLLVFGRAAVVTIRVSPDQIAQMVMKDHR